MRSRFVHQINGIHEDIILQPRTSKDPLSDPRFDLDNKPDIKNMLECALLAMEKRQGNCHARSTLVAKYLWEHPQGIQKIEIVAASNFDHTFVIVNRSGRLNKPATWGDAWIVDAWYGSNGIIFPAAEFEKRLQEMKQFCCEQLNLFGQRRMKTYEEEVLDDSETVCELVCDIRPKEDLYPTYSTNPFLPVEFYYRLKNAYPKTLVENGWDSLRRSFTLHKRNFRLVLNDIEALADDQGKRIKR